MKKYVVVGAFVFLLGLFFILFPDLNSLTKRKPILKVAAYSSFLSYFGPAQRLKELFEDQCQCQVEYINIGEVGLLEKRWRWQKEFFFDGFMGLDFLTASGIPLNRWKRFPIQLFETLQSQVPWPLHQRFLPYDWAPLGFLYDKRQVKISPHTLEDLKPYKISLPDPRTSGPGLQFLFWLFTKPFSIKDFLKNYKVSLAPSWSVAYGLFLKREVSVIFSYLTSVYAHWDKKEFYIRPFIFPQGHPVQVEFFVVSSLCRSCELAFQWAAFLLTPEAQKILAQKNYMLPVVKGVALKRQALPSWHPLPTFQLKNFIARKKEVLKEWSKALVSF
ncbi:MAG: thiamine ABC transporter substrate-binding protein [Bdellovibrio sp.]|nr:MAG: thiamine ABC transporter substrate-binding protein [Bdellovibrio sp.]